MTDEDPGLSYQMSDDAMRADIAETNVRQRRARFRKALADSGVAVAQGEWVDGLLDRLEAAVPDRDDPLPVPEEESNPT